SSEFAVARYNTNGSLDTTFGSGGIVYTAIGTFAMGHAGALHSGGKLVGGGKATPTVGSHEHFALARYNSDGSLDTSFGSGGSVTTAVSSTFNDSINGLAIQPGDGKIIAVGFEDNYHSALARYNPDGSLDATFGSGGVVAPTFGTGLLGDTGVALQS